MKAWLRSSFGRAWLLAVLLLAAQAAGLAHRIAHAVQGSANQGAGVQTLGSAWNASHQPGSADCRLVDQLTHADALCGPVATPTAPPLRAGAQALADPAGLPARPTQAYLARAPPPRMS